MSSLVFAFPPPPSLPVSSTTSTEQEWHESPSTSLTDASVETGNANTTTCADGTWDSIHLDAELLRGVYNYGFETPSPIQHKTFVPFSQGCDIIAQAQSGTGKTGAFVLGALSRLLTWWKQNGNGGNSRENDRNEKVHAHAQAEETASAPAHFYVLLLAPTRELALQIATVAQHLATHLPFVYITTMVGGTPMTRQQVQSLQTEPYQLVVGTPGRVVDTIRRRKWRSQHVRLFVLDEADEMVAPKFMEQLQYVMEALSPRAQKAFFSATFSAELMDVVEKWMHQPVHISVKREQLTLEGIKQYFVALPNERCKLDTLIDLYSSLNVTQSIVYCNNVSRVQWLHDMLTKHGFSSECIHSNMGKGEREQVINSFRKGESRILISSDVTARGIDVQQVGVVVNYDLPRDISGYLHRIGRSGRWGRKGMAINFVLRGDVTKMREVEQYYCTQIDELPASFASDVSATGRA